MPRHALGDPVCDRERGGEGRLVGSGSGASAEIQDGIDDGLIERAVVSGRQAVALFNAGGARFGGGHGGISGDFCRD